MEYLLVKWIHIVSSTILFGTGIGSAFYLLFVSLHRDVRAIAVVSKYVVIADWLFTSTTAVLQPLTGFYMAHIAKMDYSSRWLMWSILLYVVAIACWLPVVWLQMKLRDVAQDAVDKQRTALPAQYWTYLKLWIALGVPALFAFLAIFYLMVAKLV